MCSHFYAHEKNTIKERSKLVCAQVDITNLQDRKHKMDIVDFFYKKKNQYTLEILQHYKFNNFCFVTQRGAHGL